MLSALSTSLFAAGVVSSGLLLWGLKRRLDSVCIIDFPFSILILCDFSVSRFFQDNHASNKVMRRLQQPLKFSAPLPFIDRSASLKIGEGLIAIHGASGIGKTTAVRQLLAAQQRTGIYCSLRRAQTKEKVVAALSDAFGVRTHSAPELLLMLAVSKLAEKDNNKRVTLVVDDVHSALKVEASAVPTREFLLACTELYPPLSVVLLLSEHDALANLRACLFFLSHFVFIFPVLILLV
jgi:hypothetical protein